jgi:hypothetical protein
LGFPFLTFSQNISLEVQAVASGFIEDDQGRNVDWTLGVPFAQLFQNDYHLTEGFHQGSLLQSKIIISDSTAFDRSEEDSILFDNSMVAMIGSSNIYNFKLFPNPCQDVLNLYIDNLEAPQIDLLVFNLVGQLVLEQQPIDIDTTLSITISSINHLPSGPYFIQVNSNGNLLQTLRFVKL